MEKGNLIHRRHFLKTSAAAGIGLTVVPGSVLKAGPSGKLNIALIGVWGRGYAHIDSISEENVVALCDVDENHLAEASQKFPKARTYVDWRKCLDQKDLEAVVICTLDHTHAFIASWAMNRGLHVYCEKPLANSIEEARLVRGKYLKMKNKIATQVGTQRHAIENFNRVRELIKDGVIGELKSVYAWGNRQLRRPGYLSAQGDPPTHLHYDLWLGPSPYHPYNPGYFSGRAGLNCLQWNMYWDFGTGQVGDMGSHTMDLAWNAIDAGLPTSAVAEGDKFNPEVSPVEFKATYDHPANDWRGPIKVSWYQGGAMPRSPKEYVDLNQIDHGAMFKGSEGFVIAGFDSRIILPLGPKADMSYYNRRPKEKMIPQLGHFQGEWINACKTDLKTSCDFDYGGTLIEQMLLGLVSYRLGGEKLEYDGKTGKITNSAKAHDDLIYKRQYRNGWTLEG